MNFIYFISFVFAILLTIPVSTMGMQVRPEEYLGCFTILEENRIFVSSPGDYNSQDISPLYCLRQCGKKYRYATLQEGNICLCADSMPTAGQVEDSQCNKPCPGHQSWPSEDQASLKCGGRLRNSIYSASERILGLKLVKNGRLPVLRPVTISGNLTNGVNVTFTFILGDGSRSHNPADQPKVDHIYDQPGSYIVSMQATNPITGSITVSEVFDVDDPLGPVELHCPHSVPLGAWVECNGSLIRGTRINNTFSFDDGLYESISLSSRYYSAGPRIPRENQTYSYWSASAQGTIVSPAYEFRHDGKVTEWEFEAVKTGDIKLQIFRPRCLPGETYCLSNKSCLPVNETCQPINKNKCRPTEIFCIFRRRCIANSTESKISCKPLVPYQTDAPRADYQLISENRITIDAIGHHIKSLPISEQPTVQQGDVLGWISHGGMLAFRVITPADGAAFEFEYGSHPNIGGKLLRTSNFSMHHRHYIVAAHYVHSADFVIRHLYNSTGMKQLTSNITGTMLVAVDIPVGDHITMTHRSVVNTHDAVVFNIAWHSGSNISYLWDFADGNVLRTQVNSTSHAYASSGTYHVTLIVANSVNQKVLNTVVYVFDFIKGLRFSRPVKAKAIGLATQIEWESAEGTNVTYVVDFGDGSPRYETITALEASRSGFINHTYAAVGNYTVTLFAFNRVGPNISISSQALVEIPVAEVYFSLPAPHVTQTVYFAVGDTVTVNRVVGNGTNVKCAFDFKDGSAVTVSTEYSTSHVYNKTGSYKVEIDCYNAVNSVKRLLNATVAVQNLEKITGLAIDAPPSVFGSDSEIRVRMDSGTTFFCDVSFGDGGGLRIDFSHLGDVLHHRFSAVGSYNISVICYNRLGSEEYTRVHVVDIAIEDVIVTSDKRFIRVHESVPVGVTVKEGTRMKFLWDFSDGSTYSAYRQIADVNESVTSTHAFSHSGKFPVNVTVFNSLSSVSRMLPYTLVAQYPVENIALASNSPVRLDPGIARFQLSLKSNSTAPTDAVCRWDFNDGSSSSGSENLEISSNKSQERSHTFRREGSFRSTVNISNHVSNLVLSVKVDVQKIIDVSITVGRLEDGLMTWTKDYFPSNEAVHFNVTSQPKDLSYIWNFGDGSPLSISTTPSTSHTFNLSGEYKVEVTVDNILAKLAATKDVTIQRAVGEISVTSSYPNYKSDPTYFTIDIEDPGTDSCFVLDFGDAYKHFFNGRHCKPPQFIFHTIDASQTQVNVTHVYSSMGSFPVTLTASNMVSTKIASTLVNVSGNPCDIPTVKIAGDSSNDPPTEVQKSERLILRGQVTYRCPVASSLVFTWGVYEVSLADPHNESKPLDLSVNLVRMVNLSAAELNLGAADLAIKERKLPFGLIKFSLKLGFIGKNRDLSDIFETHTVWIEVKRSELEAVIRGSVKRSVGYQLPLTLDGTDSKDPDVLGDMAGITFKWMCKKKGEEFPKEGSAPSSDGGCWENGTFVFGGNNQKVVVYTGDFYQKAYYDFRLTISKDTRVDNFDQSVQVLVGQPPTMVIENVFNKLVKRNPFQRLIVEGRCIDCKMDDRLEYKWKLSLLDESLDGTLVDETSDDSWKEITDWADKTATGLSSSSLVIESGFLIAGRKYRLQLNAWRPGGEPGGYVIEELFMNVAPAKGSCQLPITQGYALETEFVVKCEGWEDDDKPLSYLIELQNGEEIIPMAAGLEPEMPAAFPLGKEENNYTIKVNVKVMDAYMLSTETFFTVRVLEPVSIDYDKVMGDMTGSADEEGGDQKAVQLATAASSVLNAKAGKSSGNDSSAESERAAFRGKVAGALSNLPVKDFDGVAMKGEALNSLTQATGEVDEDAQNATVKALDEMGDFLSGSDSARDVENVAKSLGSAIGNVVGASIDSYQKAANGTSSGDPSKSKNNTKNALGVVDKVSGALLKQLAAGDKPKAISSPNLDMSIGRKTLDGIGGEDDEDDEEEGTGGVKLPNPLALFGGANASVDEGATSAIGSTLSAMDKNPFAWDNSSSDLNSKTVKKVVTRKRFKRSVSKVSFASSVFVAPNPIDFNKVFNANLAENPVALATYDVLSTIVELMDQRGFTALQKVRLTRDNVRPIFRKDISGKAPPYFEISAGCHYYVFSASSSTGDHRLVDSGKGIRPTELLNNQALIKGETCDKYYRITAVSALYTCENSKGLLVASTYDFVSDAPIDNVNLKNKKYYYHLQTNLRPNLSEFNKEWQELYKETKDSAEWTTEQILTEQKQDANITRYAEEALRTGSSVKVALGNQFSRVSIRVTGTGRNTSGDDEPLEEWQRRLCQVLDRVCLNGSKKINKEAIEKAPNGISYIKLSVSEDKDRVRKILQNAEVEFVIEFRISEDGRRLLVRKRFAIDLSPSRKRRWSSWITVSVPQEWRFPDYNQHDCCGCKTGCGPVAWAQIFAYYDRLAHAPSSYGYSKHLYRCTSGITGSSACRAPWTMTTTVKSYIEHIRSRVDTFCLSGGGATTHRNMKDSKLKSFYSSRQRGGTIYGYTSWWSSLPGIYHSWIRDRAIQAVKDDYPAIVGLWSGKSLHYAVVTKYRYRYRRYRYCWWFFGRRCGSWKTEYDHELFYHMGWGGSSNGWRTAKAFSAFVAKK